MKKRSISVLAVLLCLFILCSCKAESEKNLWEGATYSEDAELGSGAKCAVVEVKVEEKSVTFTINTDKSTVGEALLEHDLIDGEEGPYGIYIKAVNGITADYDVDKSYWAFYIDGNYATSGVDTTPLTEGETYQLVYTK